MLSALYSGVSSSRYAIRHAASSAIARITGQRTLATLRPERDPDLVTIVEVGPRDGLQNEKSVISTDTKIELVNRLSRVGLSVIEAGSFVSPKWVPQMAGSADVLKGMERLPDVHYPVLVPNLKGLSHLIALLRSNPTTSPLTDEIAVFTAATDAFSQANTNCTVAESLDRLSAVTRTALDNGLRVRGYVSVVIDCPYSGKVDPTQVRDIAKILLDMGCYEVSLGDTVGTGNTATVGTMLETVTGVIPVEKLAGHFHDTYGMAVSNGILALSAGIRTLDSSIGGLGGCPYSPGATGNVATEDILYALRGTKYHTRHRTEDRLVDVAEIGWWISEQLGRASASRVGRALKAKHERQKLREKANAKL
ncbi:aldolase [Punctularia strigosozonata HHB-11173 SS5]|uniref:aldolase n=1 Tax=Punctularia strigosozonata (strain HHB-11173) TaxID=741275 RepID=UPI00044166F0|nr:aldolase [Punctularia strigosozonata HHB-11173 SS5]EIN14446.1 aldolase [Punctularia strigosozonata HHB-11173 SS5]